MERYLTSEGIDSSYSCGVIYKSVPITHDLLLHKVCVMKVNICRATCYKLLKVCLKRRRRKNEFV